MKKRFFAALLSLAMVLTLLPTWAMADGGTTYEVETYAKLYAAISEAPSGSTIKLMADIKSDHSYVIFERDGKYTLDLNGHTLSVGTANAIEVRNNADLTICDSNKDGGGTVESIASFDQRCVITAVPPAKVTIEDGTYRVADKDYGENPISEGKAFYAGGSPSGQGSTMTINGGTFISPDASWIANGATCTINGGKFTVTNNDQPMFLLAETEWLVDFTLRGGSYNKTTYVDRTYSYVYNYDFSSPDTAWKNIVAEGYVTRFDETNRYYHIVLGDAAMIGTTSYDTLQEAASAAKTGDTVKLLRNTTESVTFGSADEPETKAKVTLDLNGHEVTGGSDAPAITAQNIDLTITDTSYSRNGVVKSTADAALSIQGTAHVTIEEGYFWGNTKTDPTYWNNAVSIEIVDVNASRVDAANDELALTLTGGYFHESGYIVDEKEHSMVRLDLLDDTEGSKCTYVEITSFVPYGYALKDDGWGGYKFYVGEAAAVAKIGTEKYYSLREAANAAKTDDTVKLMQNTTESVTFGPATLEGTKAAVTLDLNGHEVTGGSDAPAITAQNIDLTITDKSANKDGKVTGNAAAALYIDESATVTIEEGYFSGNLNCKSGEKAVFQTNFNGLAEHLTLKGGHFSNWYYGEFYQSDGQSYRGDVNATIPADRVKKDNGTDGYPYYIDLCEAMITFDNGEGRTAPQYYKTLGGAFAASGINPDKPTITLLKDVTKEDTTNGDYSFRAPDMTLDLNGHTLTLKSVREGGNWSHGWRLIVQDDRATIKNGTIVEEYEAGRAIICSGIIEVIDGCNDLTIQNLNIVVHNSDHGAIAFYDCIACDTSDCPKMHYDGFGHPTLDPQETPTFRLHLEGNNTITSYKYVNNSMDYFSPPAAFMWPQSNNKHLVFDGGGSLTMRGVDSHEDNITCGFNGAGLTIGVKKGTTLDIEGFNYCFYNLTGNLNLEDGRYIGGAGGVFLRGPKGLNVVQGYDVGITGGVYSEDVSTAVDKYYKCVGPDDESYDDYGYTDGLYHIVPRPPVAEVVGKQYPYLERAVSAVNELGGGTIKLVNDIELKGNANAGVHFYGKSNWNSETRTEWYEPLNVTLDLNGHTITSDLKTINDNGYPTTIEGPAIIAEKCVNLTITDTGKTGAVIVPANGHGYLLKVESGATATIADGIYTRKNETATDYPSANMTKALYQVFDGQLNIAGGTFSGDTLVGFDSQTENAGSCVVTGGSFDVERYVENGYVSNINGTLTLKGGHFSTNTAVYELGLDVNPTKKLAEYLAPQYEEEHHAGDAYPYWVVPDYVAMIGEQGYLTLQEAANAGGKIKLLKDVTLSNAVTVSKAVSLDLNGKTITGENASVFNVTADGTLTLTDSGKTKGAVIGKVSPVVRVAGGKFTMDGVAIKSETTGVVGVSASGSGKIEIRSGSVITKGAPVVIGSETATIVGGTFSADVTNVNGATGYECTQNSDHLWRVRLGGGKEVEIPKEVPTDLPITGTGEGGPTEKEAKDAIKEVLENSAVPGVDTGIADATPVTEATKEKIKSGNQFFDLSMILNAIKKEADGVNHNYATSVVNDDELTITPQDCTEEKFYDIDVTKSMQITLTGAGVEKTESETQTGKTVVEVKSMSFDVKPLATVIVTKNKTTSDPVTAVIPNKAILKPITFRLPVPDSWAAEGNKVKVIHCDSDNTEDVLGFYDVQGESDHYIELANDKFSTYTITSMSQQELLDGDYVAKVGAKYYKYTDAASLQEAVDYALELQAAAGAAPYDDDVLFELLQPVEIYECEWTGTLYVKQNGNSFSYDETETQRVLITDDPNQYTLEISTDTALPAHVDGIVKADFAVLKSTNESAEVDALHIKLAYDNNYLEPVLGGTGWTAVGGSCLEYYYDGGAEGFSAIPSVPFKVIKATAEGHDVTVSLVESKYTVSAPDSTSSTPVRHFDSANLTFTVQLTAVAPTGARTGAVSYTTAGYDTAVETNNGYTFAGQVHGDDVGDYAVTLTLSDPNKYMWDTSCVYHAGTGESKLGKIVINADGTANYYALTITKAENTVSFDDSFVAEVTFGGGYVHTATATFKETGEPTIQYYEGDVTGATLGTPIAMPNGAGTYTVVASVAGNDNYEGCEARRIFTIKKAPVTVTDPTLNVNEDFSEYVRLNGHKLFQTLGTAEHGTIRYYMSTASTLDTATADTNWNVPSVTDVVTATGTYHVWAKFVPESANYTAGVKDDWYSIGSVTISKADMPVTFTFKDTTNTTPATAGELPALSGPTSVTNPSDSGLHLSYKYLLLDTAETPTGSEPGWMTEFNTLTRSAVGKYPVWIKVTDEDGNYKPGIYKLGDFEITHGEYQYVAADYVPAGNITSGNKAITMLLVFAKEGLHFTYDDNALYNADQSGYSYAALFADGSLTNKTLEGTPAYDHIYAYLLSGEDFDEEKLELTTNAAVASTIKPKANRKDTNLNGSVEIGDASTVRMIVANTFGKKEVTWRNLFAADVNRSATVREEDRMAVLAEVLGFELTE